MAIYQLSDIFHSIQEVEEYLARKKKSSKHGTAKDVVGETTPAKETETTAAKGTETTAAKETETAVEQNVVAVGRDTDAEGNDAAGENTGNEALRGKGKKSSDGQGQRRYAR